LLCLDGCGGKCDGGVEVRLWGKGLDADAEEYVSACEGRAKRGF